MEIAPLMFQCRLGNQQGFLPSVTESVSGYYELIQASFRPASHQVQVLTQTIPWIPDSADRNPNQM